MTTTTTTQCSFCGAAATAIKIEADRTYDDECTEIITQVLKPVCADCAEYWYDGTEDFPGVLLLAS